MLLITIITISAYIGGLFIIGIAADSSNGGNRDIYDDLIITEESQGKVKDIQQDACCGHTDTTPPSIQLASPANNSFTPGGTTIRISIIDNNPFDDNKATDVRYHWGTDSSNTTLEESDEDFIYKVDLPTTEGKYLLYVYAGDRSGNWNSAVFGFTAIGAVTNPPTIDFITPSTSNETLEGLYLFQVSVTDDLGLLEVKAQIDRRASQLMTYDDASGYYYYLYNVSKLFIGTHWLNVTATDIDDDQHIIREKIDFFVLEGEEKPVVEKKDPPEWSLSYSDLPENLTEVEPSDYKAESDDIYFMVAVKDDNGISSVTFTVYALDDYDPSTDEPDSNGARKELSVSLSSSGNIEEWITYEYTWDSTTSIDSYYLCEFEIQDADEIAHQMYIRVVLETDNVLDKPSSVDFGGAPGFEMEIILIGLISWVLIITLIKRQHRNR